MSKKIHELPIPSDLLVADGNQLAFLGAPADGKLYQGTIAQFKKAFSTFPKKYTATGSEGTTLDISEVSGKQILSIAREGSTIYPVDASPDSLEYIHTGTNIITLGLAVQQAGERFLILYKTPY